jgi:hypothetical protein
LFKDFMIGIAQGAATTGIGAAGSMLAEGAISEAQKQAASAARTAVHGFLESPQGKRLLALHVFANFAKGAGAKVAGPLAQTLREKVVDPLNQRLSAMLPRLSDVFKDVKLPAALKKALITTFGEQLAKAKQSAVARQVRAMATPVLRGIKYVASTILEAFSTKLTSDLIDAAVDTVFNGKQLFALVREKGLQAALGTDAAKKAADIIATATKIGDLVNQGFDAASALMNAVEQRLFSMLPGKVQDAVTLVGDTVGFRPGMVKRAAREGVEALAGGDQMASSKDAIRQVAKSGADAGQEAAQEAVDKGSGYATKALIAAELMHDLTYSKKGEEPEAAGRSIVKMAVRGGGGILAGALAAAVSAPVWVAGGLGIAGGYLASRSDTGKAAMELGGRAMRAATEAPVAGLPLKKGIEGIAWLGAKAGLLGRQMLPEGWGGGSKKEIEASETNVDEKEDQLRAGISLKNLLYGPDADVFHGILETIKSRIGRARTVVVNVSENERATSGLVKAAIVRAYSGIGERTAREEIDAIQVTGKGFQIKLTPDNIEWGGGTDRQTAGE